MLKDLLADHMEDEESYILEPVFALVNYARLFPNISKIEVLRGQNFWRWQERAYNILDMSRVIFTLIKSKPHPVAYIRLIEKWTFANKVCHHIIITTLSNELFNVDCSFKGAKAI